MNTIHSFTLSSSSREELIDITGEVRRFISTSGVTEGACFAYTPHTTAALTINENADPTVRRDIVKGLSALNLERVSFAHLEGNSPAHIKSSLVGCSLFVLIEKGAPVLGTWQGIYFCEFDGPRTRKVMLRIG
ncbi:MAG: secondary thiamine-phosphate synthase enzyme YjbQ [Spirochaetes bacterium]|jgi:secondary thiamine-phosphate synthase enzyme|nr:secondary thiamine-phosphate synthase enzyme YjbQ [Spirochaetota bacterium]